MLLRGAKFIFESLTLGPERGILWATMVQVNQTIARYAIRGQVREVYACHPNPTKEGRSLGYIVCQDQDQDPIKVDAHDSKGWKVVLCSPSTSLTIEVIKWWVGDK